MPYDKKYHKQYREYKKKQTSKVPDVINFDIGYFLITGWKPSPFHFMQKSSDSYIEEYTLPKRQ